MILLTPQLWKTLATPAHRHPLYKRVSRGSSAIGWWTQAKHTLQMLAPVVFLFFMLTACCITLSRAGGALAALLIPTILVFNGTYYGLTWGLSITGVIAGVRESRGWDILATLPSGALGAVWAISTGCLHREHVFETRYKNQVTVLTALLIVAAIIFIGALFDQRAQTFVVAGYILGALGASFADYVHSVVLGVLVAVLAASITRTRFDAQFWMLGGYLALQLSVYAAALVIGFVALPLFFASLHFDGWGADLTLLLLRLGVFVGLRELLIVALTRILGGVLNASAHDFRALTLPRTP